MKVFPILGEVLLRPSFRLACALLIFAGALTQASATPCTIPTINTLKPRIIGLVAQGDTTWKAGNANFGGTKIPSGGFPQNKILPILEHYNPGTFSEIGLYFFWSQIDSGPGTNPRYHYDVIDQALQVLCNYNASVAAAWKGPGPAPVVYARLKIFHASDLTDTTGAEAQPVYATKIDTTSNLPVGQFPGVTGGTSYITIYYGSTPIPIGAWWTPDYTNAWATLQTKLGNRYDTNSLIAETLMATCASKDQEVFLTPNDNPINGNPPPVDSENQMFSGNDEVYPYANATQQACLTAGAEAYRAAWPNTYLVQSYAVFGEDDPQTHVASGDSSVTSALITNSASPQSPKNQTPYCLNAISGYLNCFPASQGYLPTLVMEQTALTPTLKTTGWVGAFATYGGRTSLGVAFQPDVSNINYTDHCTSLAHGITSFNQTEFELNQNVYYGVPQFTNAQMSQMQSYLVTPTSNMPCDAQ